jgi:hypothetical protein
MTRKSNDPDRDGAGYIHPVSPSRAATLLEPKYKGQRHDADAFAQETVVKVDARHPEEIGLPHGGSGDKMSGVEQQNDAALIASELHDDALNKIEADRYFAEFESPEEQAARAERHAGRDQIIAGSPIVRSGKSFKEQGREIAARDLALAAHYAMAADDRLADFVPPDPTAPPAPKPATGFAVAKLGRKRAK